nr:synaptobrevin, longin-like domain protein [Tanacetum cinerariifolium]
MEVPYSYNSSMYKCEVDDLNEFSSSMASAVICLAIGRKFNFLKYIFDSLVRNMDSSSKFYMYPRFLQLMINSQIVDLTSHTTKYHSPTLTQKDNIDAVDDVADDVANVADVADADAEPTPPSSTPAITPPPSQQEVASTPPPSPHQSPIAQSSSPPQQQHSQPSHTTDISMDLLNTLLETLMVVAATVTTFVISLVVVTTSITFVHVPSLNDKLELETLLASPKHLHPQQLQQQLPPK